jgi:hypothetical protein
MIFSLEVPLFLLSIMSYVQLRLNDEDERMNKKPMVGYYTVGFLVLVHTVLIAFRVFYKVWR